MHNERNDTRVGVYILGMIHKYSAYWLSELVAFIVHRYTSLRVMTIQVATNV